MIHLRQRIHRVRVKRQVEATNHPERVEPVPSHPLLEYELGDIRAVQVVHTVRATDPVLEGDGERQGAALNGPIADQGQETDRRREGPDERGEGDVRRILL